jgi:L-serine dehydratase
MGLLDVIGPVMIGPSSSHTAGACRLALLARGALRDPPTRADVKLHGSFAKTAKGHGTDRALAAGLLGFSPDDPRLPAAPELAAAAGLELTFSSGDLGDVHPNTVQFTLHNAAETLTVTGSSLGGGIVRIVRVDGFEIPFSGALHTLLLRHTDQPGVIASVARVLADDGVNIATLHCARKGSGGKRDGAAMMSLELEQVPAPAVLGYLAHLHTVSWLRLLPEVMRGGSSEPTSREVKR